MPSEDAQSPGMIYADVGSNFEKTKTEIESLQNILEPEQADSFQAEAANLQLKFLISEGYGRLQ